LETNVTRGIIFGSGRNTSINDDADE